MELNQRFCHINGLMKKILIVNTGGLGLGGITTHMFNYISIINQSGIYKIDIVVTVLENKEMVDEFRFIGCGIIHVPHRQKQLFCYIMTLYRIMYTGNYDIIHVHGNSATAVLELQIAKWTGIKIRIAHNHTSRCQHKILNQLLLPQYKRVFTHAIACSEEAGKWLYGEGRFVILPNAINVKSFIFKIEKRMMVRHTLKIMDDDYIIGHVGAFMEAKNHSFLIEVFAKYHALQPKSKLLLIGDGELRHLVEAAIDKNKVNDCVILAGLRSDIPELLQAMDIFLFPSIYEGMPLSVVEAQASGLPCIISDAVTKMVNIGEDVIQLPLSKGADYWAEYLGNIKYELSRQERCERNFKLITKAGYNIETEAENLMKIYNNDI